MMNLGEKIKYLRTQHSLTLDELADRLNKKYPESQKFTKGALSKWENNNGEPRLSSIKKVADYFGVSLDYLASDSPPTVNIYGDLKGIANMTGKVTGGITFNETSNFPENKDVVGLAMANNSTQDEVLKILERQTIIMEENRLSNSKIENLVEELLTTNRGIKGILEEDKQNKKG